MRQRYEATRMTAGKREKARRVAVSDLENGVRQRAQKRVSNFRATARPTRSVSLETDEIFFCL